MRRSSLLILLVVVLGNLFIWAMLNRPHSERDYEGVIRGVSFSPYQKAQDPFKQKYPSVEDIERDLALVKDQVTAVRSYSSLNGLEEIPRLARRHGLEVTAGAWLDRRPEVNDQEIRSLIRNVNRYSNIERVIVGNESILREDLTPAQLTKYLREVKRLVNVPVSTAEPWHIWLKHRELAKEVDYIAIHVLPYWEETPVDNAVPWVLERYRQIHQAFPDKPVVLAEVGWPSAGHRIKEAEASVVNQAKFIRNFLNAAQQHRLDYFIMEAFDQPWKWDPEGPAGAFWGLWDADRHEKFPMTGLIETDPLWKVQAIGAAVLALLPMAWFLLVWRDLRAKGRLFFALLLQTTASMVIWTAFVPFTRTLSMASEVIWALLLPAQLALLAVVLINGFEMTEALWSRGWKRHFKPLNPPRERDFPKVSLHLAICNEPAEMVKVTLDSLAALDYPNFEVLVVDNNTADPAIWEPVRDYCAQLGERFRFFHLGKWPGFKAGALNFALKETAPDAEIVGLIDSDYVVQADWLRTLAPYFDEPSVGFVQAPQDNRAWENDRFKEMINWEYNGFFQIGMMHRNERNAIIQHGTMTLIRRRALEELGCWNEKCICEDAELGLRLMHAGLQAIYVNYPFGHGLTPDSFGGYKRQRFRWAYGAVQIMKQYWRWMIPGMERDRAPGMGLTTGQQFHFITGWLPWFSDALHLVFTAMAILWSVGLVAAPKYFGFPIAVFLVPTLGIFIFKMLHSYWLYEAKVRCTFRQRIGAAIAGMSLTHTIARAMIQGLFTSSTPFLRTPKCESRPALIQGLLMAREELVILGLLWASALAVLIRYGAIPEALIWCAVLLVQSSPYVAAGYTSIVNELPEFRLSRLLAWRPGKAGV